ncbi:Metallocarboxypeptidase inhibitor [Cucumis melo var. makuwa]|uniref:Metallocarboxypeptidase inhibitor n=1 Tax=Cucumis melo var. makuwa TaxID=1194695 RepID=A0A5A7V540_CUCMM|nr:Metallocarboxypeptidase inhibitor [Cucumis melo var. makuwa]
MKIDGECLIELIGSCRNKVQVYRSVRMPQLHTSLHFHLTPIGQRTHCCLAMLPEALGSWNRRALLLGWAYYLDAFSSYPLRTWLPNLYCGHDNWYTRAQPLEHTTTPSGEVPTSRCQTFPFKLPSAFTLEGQSPSGLRKPLYASITFWGGLRPMEIVYLRLSLGLGPSSPFTAPWAVQERPKANPREE